MQDSAGLDCALSEKVVWPLFAKGRPDLAAARVGEPVRDGAGGAGYGLLQLDPPGADDPSAIDAIWNWKSNVTKGLSGRLDGFGGPKQDLGGVPEVRAYPWWFNQVTQWQTYMNPQGPGVQPPPPVPEPTETIGACTFRAPVVNKGATSDTGGQTNTYWYADAILMRQMAAGYSPHYISWNVATHQWVYNKTTTITYKDPNGGEIFQVHNPVYEFCTCAPTNPLPNASCQHTTP